MSSDAAGSDAGQGAGDHGETLSEADAKRLHEARNRINQQPVPGLPPYRDEPTGCGVGGIAERNHFALPGRGLEGECLGARGTARGPIRA